MTAHTNCKKLGLTCSKLSNKCESTLGTALGTSNNAKKCKKNGLGNDKSKNVNTFCPDACGMCGKCTFQIWRP